MYSLKDIKGNEKLKKVFITAKKENRVLNSYIIEGSGGSGKMFIARCIAKFLQCTENDVDVCDDCHSCVSFNSDNNPDVIYVDKDPKKTELTVDVIREKIIGDVYIKPFSYRYKIYIINNADKMNISAQNAFLKTLEEPPDYAMFILIAENTGKFLLTILSRCTVFRTERLAPEIIKNYLFEKGLCDKSQAEVISNYCGGNIGTALKILNDSEFNQLRNKVFDIFLKITNQSDGERKSFGIEDIYNAVDFFDANRQNIDMIFDTSVLFYRDALVFKCMGSDIYVINKDKLYEIRKLADKMSIEKMTENIQYITEAQKSLNSRVNFTQTMEVMFFGIKENKRNEYNRSQV